MSASDSPPSPGNPCPFCGGFSYGEYATATPPTRAFRQRHWRQCANVRCNARGPIRWTRDKAMHAWNRRKEPK